MIADARTAGPGVFVVSTGRCGSTMLSNMLRLNPGILSLSEFFSLLMPDPSRRVTWTRRRTGGCSASPGCSSGTYTGSACASRSSCTCRAPAAGSLWLPGSRRSW